MIKLIIGTDERELRSVTRNWINQQINNRLRANQAICIQVRIEERDMDIILSTPDCRLRGGIDRPLTQKELKAQEIWRKHKLNTPNFTDGSVVGFLNQLSNII